MKIKSISHKLISGSVLSFFLVMFSTNHCFSGEIGVTRDTIKLGYCMAMSGFLASAGVPIAGGTRLVFQDKNDQGGIYGRKIKLLVEDDQYRPALTVTMTKKLLYREKIFSLCGYMGASNVLAIAPILKKEKLPIVTVSSSRKLSYPPKRYIFPFIPPNDFDAYILVDYIMKDLKAKNPRIAVFCMENDMGLGGLRGMREALKPYGLKLVAEEMCKPSAVDFTSQIIGLKIKKPDYVVYVGVPRSGASFLAQCKRLSFSTQFIGTTTSMDDKLVELAGDAAEGFIGTTSPVLWHSDDPGAVKYRELLKKYQPKQIPAFVHIMGYNCAIIVWEGLKRAGRNLTREGFVDALETLKDFDAGMVKGVTYGPNERLGARSYLIVKADVKNKRFIPITDWRKVTPPPGSESVKLRSTSGLI